MLTVRKRQAGSVIHLAQCSFLCLILSTAYRLPLATWLPLFSGKDPERHLASYGLCLLVLKYDGMFFLFRSHFIIIPVLSEWIGMLSENGKLLHPLVCIDSPCCPSSAHMREKSTAFRVPSGALGDRKKNKMVARPSRIYELKLSSRNPLRSL